MTQLPPWRSPLARALHRNRSLPHAKFAQLATVDDQGRPHNRTVVFRGLLDSDHWLTFITDHRSSKRIHLQVQPWVELCWYFTKTREQFRFSGRMQMIGSQNLAFEKMLSTLNQEHRISAWQRLSDRSKQQFYWPTPGTERSPDLAFEDIEPTSLPPDTFVLLLLQPEQVDHLQLQGNPQQRDRYVHRKDSCWHIEAINP